jgi:hypothetical protein
VPNRYGEWQRKEVYCVAQETALLPSSGTDMTWKDWEQKERCMTVKQSESQVTLWSEEAADGLASIVSGLAGCGLADHYLIPPEKLWLSSLKGSNLVPMR